MESVKTGKELIKKKKLNKNVNKHIYLIKLLMIFLKKYVKNEVDVELNRRQRNQHVRFEKVV